MIFVCVIGVSAILIYSYAPRREGMSVVDNLMCSLMKLSQSVMDPLWMVDTKNFEKINEFRKRFTKIDTPSLSSLAKWENEEFVIPNTKKSCQVRVFWPGGRKNGTNVPLLVYYHGGGMCIGNAVDMLFYELMKHFDGKQIAVAAVDYRMSPEHPFPVPHDDSVAALVWLHSNAQSLSVDPDNITVVGYSAGGNLAAVVSIAAKERGISLKHVVPMVPMTNCLCKSESYTENGNIEALPTKLMEWFWRCYAGTTLLAELHKNPQANPVAADLRDVAPTTVFTARWDALRSDGCAYVDALKDAGVEVQHIELKGTHSFAMIGGSYPDNFKLLFAVLDKATGCS